MDIFAFYRESLARKYRRVNYYSRSLLRSDGKSHVDNTVVGERDVGDDKVILEVTGNDNPAALIATFNGIVMNG